MSHDPLCLWAPDEPQADGSFIGYGPCICTEILQARKQGQRDERARIRAAMTESPWCCNCTAPVTTSGDHDDWCMSNHIDAVIDAGGES